MHEESTVAFFTCFVFLFLYFFFPFPACFFSSIPHMFFFSKLSSSYFLFFFLIFFVFVFFFSKLSSSILFFYYWTGRKFSFIVFFLWNIIDCYSVFPRGFCFITVFFHMFFFSKIIFVEFIFLILRWLRI